MWGPPQCYHWVNTWIQYKIDTLTFSTVLWGRYCYDLLTEERLRPGEFVCITQVWRVGVEQLQKGIRWHHPGRWQERDVLLVVNTRLYDRQHGAKGSLQCSLVNAFQEYKLGRRKFQHTCSLEPPLKCNTKRSVLLGSHWKLTARLLMHPHYGCTQPGLDRTERTPVMHQGPRPQWDLH